jgi:hypothetical protein
MTQQDFANWLEGWLRQEFIVGAVTPDKLASAGQIVDEYTAHLERIGERKEINGLRPADSQVRDAINFLRTTRGMMIVSASSGRWDKPGEHGYSLTYDLQVFRSMNEHLVSRSVKIYRAYANPIKKYFRDHSGQGSLFEIPVEQDFVEKLKSGT